MIVEWSLIAQMRETPVLDWVAVLCSIVYVYLAARDNNWCWLFAAIGSVIWAHQMFVVYALPSDALLQLFYLVMAGLGLYRWRRKAPTRAPETQALDSIAVRQRDEGGSAILQMTPGEHLVVISGGLLLGYGLANFMMAFRPGAVMVYWDGITTTFSILATFLLIARRIENWLYFIVIDLAYVYIYLRRAADLYALIMVVYVIVAVYGYLHWWRLSAVDRSHETPA